MLNNLHVVELPCQWQRASASLKFRTRKPFAKCRVLVHNVVMQKIRLPRHGCLYGSCQRLILLSAIALLGMGGTMLRADQIVYDDALENGWQNWSWATVNLDNQFTRSFWFRFHQRIHRPTIRHSIIHHTAMNASQFTNITFWINGGQRRTAVEYPGDEQWCCSSRHDTCSAAANTWQQKQFPLPHWVSPTLANFRRILDSGCEVAASHRPFMWMIFRFPPTAVTTTGTNAPVAITVDASANRHPISPLIYGVAFASSASDLQDLNAPLHRSGGNAETRYNWQINATSHAADWYFESIADRQCGGRRRR